MATSTHKRLRLLTSAVLAILLLIPTGAFIYKVTVLNYRITNILPQTEYRVGLRMTLDGGEGRVRVATYAPADDVRQTIREESQSAPQVFHHTFESEGLNRQAIWLGAPVPDGSEIRYEFSALLSAVHFSIAPDLAVPESYPQSVREHLQPTEDIQVDAPEVRERLRAIGADRGPLGERIQRIYGDTDSLGFRTFKGTTDALTALRLGEASCNGKSRLFVALARATGIPARLVGGLVLEPGSKRTSHQWVEVYIAGHWVPFDPTNHHYAALPSHYLTLYRGDEVLFRHTGEINFDYMFTTRERLVPSPEARASFSAFNVWDLFARLHLPFSLLQTVLMLPIGALVVVLFRNVIGVPTFGTFLPALIAASMGATGLVWGMVSLVIVTCSVVSARLGLQRLQLLHSPTLAILLTVVVLSMLGTSLVADHLDLEELARVAHFPIAVMAIVSENLYLVLAEKGVREGMKHFWGTLMVVLACYLVMNSMAMQVLVIGFPEVLLLVIAANIYLGRWVGVRLIELWRFRRLWRNEEVRA
ncbi:7TM domain-containing protein [Nannocystis pusilla]|uniref:7TM domain-containing protein n=1 Tax=Nannocystis pusilla TaxID=889268 RepID=UPI003BF229B8